MRAYFLLLFLYALPVLAQDTLVIPEIKLDKKDQKKMEFAGVYKSSIGLELGGKSGLVGITYDLLLSRHWRIGIGAGYPGVGAEVKCFPFGVKRDKLLFNIGARANAFFPVGGSDFMFYSVPLGISFFTVNRVNLEIDCGPLFKSPLNSAEPLSGIGNEINYIWFSVKLGYRFSFYAIRRARQLNRNSE